MIIRKMYKFEAAHIVRNCASKRCSKSLHGHSYLVEFLLRSETLDNGGMVIDFGLLKNNLGAFADSFDHAFMVQDEDAIALEVALMSSERVIISPYNMTAENMAKIFFMGAEGILHAANYNNGEYEINVDSVIVHETATGYAQAFEEDIQGKDRIDIKQLDFSTAIKNDWEDSKLGKYITHGRENIFSFDLPKEV